MIGPIITPMFVFFLGAGVGVGVGVVGATVAVGVGVTLGAGAYTANNVKWLICALTVSFPVFTVEGYTTHMLVALSQEAMTRLL